VSLHQGFAELKTQCRHMHVYITKPLNHTVTNINEVNTLIMTPH